MSTFSSQDQRFMQVALAYGARNLGQTAPNPSVGCVIVKNNQVIAAACTATGGRPHAEPLALEQAGEHAKDATMYVTLEPCAHTGKTGPCAQSIVNAQIKRVVIAVRDPFSHVDGKGIAMLKKAGIDTTIGVCETDAYYSHRGFFSTTHRNRPWVTVKIASTLDGYIATSSGQSQWITSEKARNYGHMLRATHDAIMVGTQTAATDNPSLTCRLPGCKGATPTRIVLDRTLSLPDTLQLFQDQTQAPSWVITSKTPPANAKATKYLQAPLSDNDKIDLVHALNQIAACGITSVLVEGGNQLVTSLLTAGLVDEIYWFRAPKLLGAGHKPAILDLHTATLADCIPVAPISSSIIGTDQLDHYQLTTLPFSQ